MTFASFILLAPFVELKLLQKTELSTSAAGSPVSIHRDNVMCVVNETSQRNTLEWGMKIEVNIMLKMEKSAKSSYHVSADFRQTIKCTLLSEGTEWSTTWICQSIFLLQDKVLQGQKLKSTGPSQICHRPLSCNRIACTFTDSSYQDQLIWSHMFHCASWSFSSLYRTRSTHTARYFHRVTTDFINYNARGNLVARNVPVIVGNPGETYVLIDPGVGSALCAASPFTSASAACAKDRCKLTFFHDSQHFGFGKLSVWKSFIYLVLRSLFSMLGSSSYPRLYVPSQIPHQTELNTSPATLFLSGKMHKIVLDGTLDGIIPSPILPVLLILIYYIYIANFAENARATAQNLEHVLDRLKDMWCQGCFPCSHIGDRLI